MEGAHDFLEKSANTDLIHQAKGEQGQDPVPTSIIETNKSDKENWLWENNFLVLGLIYLNDFISFNQKFWG